MIWWSWKSTVFKITILLVNVSITLGQCIFSYYIGQYKANCAGAGFSFVPDNLQKSIQTLDLSNNLITALPHNAFQNYQRIREVILHNNRIEAIHPDAFINRNILYRIDLSANKLQKIGNSTFHDLPALKYLDLRDNLIKTVEDDAFVNLPSLEDIDFQNCGLEFLSPHAFTNSKNKIKTINLANNQLATLAYEMKDTLAKTLLAIHLYSNPWHCDCNLRWVRYWIETPGLSWLFGGELEPRCHSPLVLRDRAWISLHPSDFACEPIISSDRTIIHVYANSKATLLCHITADPAPHITWYKDGYRLNVYDNDSGFRVSTVGTINKTSSLIIDHTNLNHTGRYECIAENAAGTVNTNFTLIMQSANITTVPPVDEEVSTSGKSSLGTGTIAAIIVSTVLFIVIIITFSCYIAKVRSARKKRLEKKCSCHDHNQDTGTKEKPDLIKHHDYECEGQLKLLSQTEEQTQDFEIELGELKYTRQLHQSRQRGPVLGQSTTEVPMHAPMNKFKVTDDNQYPSNSSLVTNKSSGSPSMRFIQPPSGSLTRVKNTEELNKQSRESLMGSNTSIPGPKKPPRTFASEEKLHSNSSSLQRGQQTNAEEYGTAV